MRKLMVAAALLALAGCDNDVTQAHKAVAAQLENPSTAKFANVRPLAQGNVCGQVRGKDAAGNYTPYVSYVAIKAEDGYHAILDPRGDNEAVRTICGSPAPEQAEADAGNGWEVRIADNAMGALSDMTSRLIEKGFVANVATRNGKTEVYLGPFATQAEAQAKKAELMASQGIEAFVVPHPADAKQ
ncbi:MULTISPECIES: SPOR domain-containing protein [unclassified Pseudomonas]|uniref:SPOR domain-containing protein n=1 Tax=unclassified Pseudomonas TaxID=196821 RepID=UPI000BCFD10C|nr:MULTISPECIES: SPOR domain-containing protein [unclassified Pseudomonas]PVZ13813.1 sporulation related protein [Pseudomonas sp. URIL14HWK12:I12]PVZ24119.1 sporulation related protein [Pseudomonas sp. URIL14HWK12:I10]PVZ33242.1 sporulation related protein [Pseudomonas sp. URIL14HWK12:I11]SNZ10836.1 Sporulation related domain-containing protein [Pseudomonas sp. URIL14HWK12:I9]